mgnify:CR=1 FL=1
MAAKTEKGLKQEIVNLFPVRLRQILEALPLDFARLEEIRLRCGQPILFRIAGKEMGITGSGDLTELGSSGKLENWEKLEKIREKELKDTLEIMGGFSLYAAEEELRQGFFTIQGGHRIGVAGEGGLEDGGVKTMKYLSFLNVRIAHEIRGCADGILPYIYEADRCEANREIFHTLLISPPRCGKTTLLRDLIRQISNGNAFHPGMTVGVVDERSEIGACYHGIPQNDLGIRSEELDDCPKHLGMMMLIRTMSPKVVAVDEIGSREDLEAMEYVMNCGCKLLATVHGNSLEEIRRKPVLGRMVEEAWFGRYVILERNGTPGHVAVVLDGQGRRL